MGIILPSLLGTLFVGGIIKNYKDKKYHWCAFSIIGSIINTMLIIKYIIEI